MRIVVTGVNGQVGWELVRSLQPLGEVIALDRTQADLSRPETLKGALQPLKADVIINAAAYTAVDKAEEEEALATRINGESVGVLGEIAQASSALLVHYSTDYVFDGSKEGSYLPGDKTNPINAYGRSKLAGEQALDEVGGDFLTLRTTWVYAARGKNFLKSMLRLGQEREELRIVADQHGAPTWARNIADATAHIVSAAQLERRAGNFDSGVYHLTSAGSTTWHGFASAILATAKTQMPAGAIRTKKIVPIATEDYPLPAPRPRNSHLAQQSSMLRFGVRMPSWESAMELCLKDVVVER